MRRSTNAARSDPAPSVEADAPSRPVPLRGTTVHHLLVSVEDDETMTEAEIDAEFERTQPIVTHGYIEESATTPRCAGLSVIPAIISSTAQRPSVVELGTTEGVNVPWH